MAVTLATRYRKLESFAEVLYPTKFNYCRGRKCMRKTQLRRLEPIFTFVTVSQAAV